MTGDQAIAEAGVETLQLNFFHSFKLLNCLQLLNTCFIIHKRHQN